MRSSRLQDAAGSGITQAGGYRFRAKTESCQLRILSLLESRAKHCEKMWHLAGTGIVADHRSAKIGSHLELRVGRRFPGLDEKDSPFGFIPFVRKFEKVNPSLAY